MAITQISQIQIRRGLQQDLPQLASGELGWSLDTQRLYIGNGTIAEGAPVQGVTEVLTQYSNFLGSTIKYTFAGTPSGYTSQTGISPTLPIQQSLQDRLDQFVTVKNFGAVGDGITDDTAAINRAIQQIYVSSLNSSHINVRRAIRFPAGSYKVTSTILVPPNCYLLGEGKNNTLIFSATVTPVTTCDSLFQSGGSLGFNGAVLPSYITVIDMAFQAPTSVPVALITSASEVDFERVRFIGGTYGVSITGTSSDIDLINNEYDGYATAPTNIASTVTGAVTLTDAYTTTQLPLAVGTTTVTTLPAGAGHLKYQIVQTGGNTRIGTMSFTTSTVGYSFTDSNVEPSVSLGANLYAYGNGLVTCTVSTASTLKYNITQFL